MWSKRTKRTLKTLKETPLDLVKDANKVGCILRAAVSHLLMAFAQGDFFKKQQVLIVFINEGLLIT